MRNLKEFWLSTQQFLNDDLVEKLVQDCSSVGQVGKLFKKEGLSFSSDSVRNIAYALSIFREIRMIPSSFFIYGSTATGTAGLEPKVQEFQFWNREDFLGSAFRLYGNSDLDLRCISENSKEISQSLKSSREKLATIHPLPVGVRIDNYELALEDITDQQGPSFYRRILLLNKPIIFSGGEIIDMLVRKGSGFLLPDDFEYETQRRQSRVLARAKLKEKPILYSPRNQLTQMFPVYYHPANLREKNIKRRLSSKISLGLKESSLIAVQVGSFSQIEEFIDFVSTHPNASLEEISSFEFFPAR